MNSMNSTLLAESPFAVPSDHVDVDDAAVVAIVPILELVPFGTFSVTVVHHLVVVAAAPVLPVMVLTTPHTTALPSVHASSDHGT